jgi:hypothetical protein
LTASSAARRLLLAAPALAAIAAAGAAPPSLDWLEPQAGPWRAALILAQLRADELAVDPTDAGLYAGERYRLPFHDLLAADPWRVSTLTRRLTDQLLAQADDPTDVLFFAEQRAGAGVGNAVLGDPLSPARARVAAYGDSALAVALSEIDGRPVREFRESGNYRLVPRAARDAAALILFQAAAALRDREQALTEPLRRRGIEPSAAWRLACDAVLWRPEELPRDERRRSADATGEDLGRARRLERILDAVDRTALYRGANRLAAAARQAIADLRAAGLRAPPGDFHYAVNTRYGWVKILGVGQHHHREDERHLLVLDLGGDDVYASAANTLDPGHPISLVIDLAGNDEYRSTLEDRPAFGAGILGYGMLFDVAGNDLYRCPMLGQGCGVLGVGLLHDAAGQDRYQGDGALQGCGVFGVGALVDLRGDDQYACYRASQGFGYTLGCGVLLDASGDDRYEANDTDIRYPAASSPPHQASLAQGVGCGRRGETADGHAWAGGVGLLVDGAGADRYGCGVLGGGSACAGGVGIFVDKSGNDDYTSFASALGCARSGGIAVVQEEAGDDLYRCGSARAFGFGAEFGLAWFEDAGGNDRYYANDGAFGVGHENGLGLFWDRAGSDTYIACNNSFGVATMAGQGTARDLMLNAGLFVDAGGADRYYQLPLEERENLPFNFRNPALFAPFEGMENGARLSRYDLLRHPGSTGAAVDTE